MMQINLNHTEANFRPGDVISADVTWSDLKGKTGKIEVRLIWYTSGKGDRDIDVVDKRTIKNPEEKGSHRVEFIAPHRPYSFSGRLISLTWSIEAIAFPQKEAERCELVLSGSGREVVLVPVEDDK